MTPQTGLSALNDAFRELERRADVHLSAHPAARVGQHSTSHTGDRLSRHSSGVTRRPRVLVAACAGAAVVVAGTAAGVTHVADHGSRRSGGPAAAGSRGPSMSGVPSRSVSPTPSQSSGSFPLPYDQYPIAKKLRQALRGVATVQITYAQTDDESTSPSESPASTLPTPTRSGPSAQAPTPSDSSPSDSSAATPTASGSANPPVAAGTDQYVKGTLTSPVGTGGFDLNVMTGDPADPPPCADTDRASCHVIRQADRSWLSTQREVDPDAAGGVTYAVGLQRPDGVLILLHLSTMADPKGDSRVTSRQIPLSQKQLVDLVNWPNW